MNRRGAVAPIAALVMTAMIGFAGLAVDATRLWLVRERLKTALDAGSLVAAREITDATRDSDARSIFWANFNQGRLTSDYLGARVTGPVISQIDSTHVSLTASVTVPATLFSVISSASTTFSEASVAQRSGTGLEIAMVLDTTMSMAAAAPGGGTKLQAAQAAVRTLLNILYGTGSDTQQNLWVSVVPFSTAVNIGTQHSGWLSSAYPSVSGYSWTGCVEARPNRQDITEANPGTAQFRPFFWASTYHQNGTVAQGKCTRAQAYSGTSDSNRYCMGDNDWGATQQEIGTNLYYSGARSLASYFGVSVTTGTIFTPNAWCPSRAIQPLTASKATVLSVVNSLTAPFGVGTVIPTGLQAAWFTLSPNWQGWWTDPNPPGGPALPLPYSTRNMKKAVVLLSDGDNNWYGSRLLCSNGDQCAVAPSIKSGELFYMAYGRLADQTRLNDFSITVSNTGNAQNDYTANQPRADAALDTRSLAVCSAMKSQGILIYVIGFEVATSANRTLLQNCSSGSQYYFESPDASQLQAAFTAVANQLASLQLTQ